MILSARMVYANAGGLRDEAQFIKDRLTQTLSVCAINANCFRCVIQPIAGKRLWWSVRKRLMCRAEVALSEVRAVGLAEYVSGVDSLLSNVNETRGAS